VTGGSSGLGAAVVTAVTKSGGRPFVIDRQPPADAVPWVDCDLADTRAAQAATRNLVEQAGGLHGVVTAAGLDVPGRLDDVPGDGWETNVAAAIMFALAQPPGCAVREMVVCAETETSYP
jgi:NAD(P)-dependent dehydrogenase (short-subunit alcohol dehydrogenase family)